MKSIKIYPSDRPFNYRFEKLREQIERVAGLRRAIGGEVDRPERKKEGQMRINGFLYQSTTFFSRTGSGDWSAIADRVSQFGALPNGLTGPSQPKFTDRTRSAQYQTTPKTWSFWLPWAEYWHNIAYRVSTNTTPFKIVYGSAPSHNHTIHSGQDTMRGRGTRSG